MEVRDRHPRRGPTQRSDATLEVPEVRTFSEQVWGDSNERHQVHLQVVRCSRSAYARAAAVARHPADQLVHHEPCRRSADLDWNAGVSGEPVKQVEQAVGELLLGVVLRDLPRFRPDSSGVEHMQRVRHLRSPIGPGPL